MISKWQQMWIDENEKIYRSNCVVETQITHKWVRLFSAPISGGMTSWSLFHLKLLRKGRHKTIYQLGRLKKKTQNVRFQQLNHEPPHVHITYIVEPDKWFLKNAHGHTVFWGVLTVQFEEELVQSTCYYEDPCYKNKRRHTNHNYLEEVQIDTPLNPFNLN